MVFTTGVSTFFFIENFKGHTTRKVFKRPWYIASIYASQGVFMSSYTYALVCKYTNHTPVTLTNYLFKAITLCN